MERLLRSRETGSAKQVTPEDVGERPAVEDRGGRMKGEEDAEQDP